MAAIKPTPSNLAIARPSSRHRFPAPSSITRLPLLSSANQQDHRHQPLRPPPPIKLTEAIKSQFNSTIPLLAARIPSPMLTQFKANPDIRKAVLNSKNLRSVEPDPDSNDQSFKLLLLNTFEKEEIPESAMKVFEAHSIELKKTTLNLNWDYWMADEIITRLLPEELTDIPASFTVVGHIAHFNLRDEYLPYKYLIGQVILEKNLSIKTVVNKIDTINSQFRFFEMELLAGESNYIVTLWQSGCRYRFDFSKVYYNPRLSTEHDLLCSIIGKDELVVDAFAGVGPFAMRAASNQKAWVLASDLNPASVEALRTNTKLNKLERRVKVSQGDGRDKIKESVLTVWKSNPFVDSNLSQTVPVPPPKLIDHFIINLPDSSISFLDAFVGLYDPLKDSEGFLGSVREKSKLPLLHCYCFTKEVDNAEADICLRVSEMMKTEITSDRVERFELKFVRAVAPHKDMYRLTFELPLNVLLSSHE